MAEQLLEVRGQLAVGPPKTGAGQRTVTLPTVAAEALAEHLSVYAEAGPDGLVFSAERGGPIRRSNFTRRVWIPATRAAGVEGLRFHDLRHTAATLAIAAGASTRELMVRMGHSSSAAALRYQHVMAGRDAAIAAALDGWSRPRRPCRSDPVGMEWHAGGTNRAARPEGPPSMIDRGGRDLLGWLVGLPGLEPGTSSLSGIEGSALCGPAFSQVAARASGAKGCVLSDLVPRGAGNPGDSTRLVRGLQDREGVASPGPHLISVGLIRPSTAAQVLPEAVAAGRLKVRLAPSGGPARPCCSRWVRAV